MPRLSPHRRLVAAVVTVTATLSACGGGESTTPTDAPSSASSTPTVAPTDAPTTTASPTTTPVVTEPVSTDPVTTDAPTTTLDPAAVEAQIRSDFEAAFNAYYECVYEPETCDFGAVNLLGSDLDSEMRNAVDELLDNNLRGLRNSGPVSFDILGIAVQSSKLAVVTACMTDGGVLVDIGLPEVDGDEVVMNDALNSYLRDWTLVVSDGVWRRSMVKTVSIFPGGQTCAA